MFQLNRFRISSRIYVGFAALIALTLALALFSTLRISSVQQQMLRFLSLSDNTTRALEAGRLLETLQRAALIHKTSQDDAAVRQFEEARAQVRELMQAAANATVSRERLQWYQEVAGGLDALEPKFQELAALGRRITGARSKLYTGGDELTAATQRLLGAGSGTLVADANALESAILLVRVANWRFLATKDPKGPAIFDTNVAQAEKVLAQLEQHTRASDLRPLVGDVASALKAYRENFGEISVSLLQADQTYAADIAPALSQMQTRLEAARSSLTRDMTDTQKSTSEALASTFWMQLVVGAALFALGATLALMIARSIVQPLEHMTRAMMRLASGELDTVVPDADGRDEIAAMGQAVQIFKRNELARQELEAQIAHGARQIATTATEQQVAATEVAATVTEIGATSKEISATSRELVKTVGEVAAVAEQSASLASTGHAGVSHMETTMRNVMDASAAINSKLAVLNEKAGNINQVVVTITKVADQTNLLSLNAAIEAEKAGEYGRGFSVVATEIRRLADQTAVATYDIEQMVKEIQSAVAAGVMGMDKFSEEVRRGMHEVQQVGGQLSQIIQQVQTLAPRIEVVNEGMQAQATGAEQITQALSQLTEATQQTVESLRRSAGAIEELNKVSSGLRDGVTRASSHKRGPSQPERLSGEHRVWETAAG